MALKSKNILKQAVVTPDQAAAAPEVTTAAKEVAPQVSQELDPAGFNAEKMRKCCTKCGCTQLVTESITKTLAADGISLASRSVILRCNDCNTKFKG